MGCTEPVSVALCAAHAAKALKEPVAEALIILDGATYKNGMGVNLPNSGGEKGNLLAAALGLLIARPELRMEILKASSPSLVKKAKKLLKNRKVTVTVAPDRKDIYLEARAKGKNHSASCVIEHSHSEISLLERDGNIVTDRRGKKTGPPVKEFKKILAAADIAALVKCAEKMDAEDASYIKKGVNLNMEAARHGMKLKKVGYYIKDLLKRGFIIDDVFSSSKILAAFAADARMEGLAVPVMSSGESGNQGIVAILVPWNVGKAFAVDEQTVLKSIALSHLINAYVKVHTGSLAPICGCAIAAGLGASAAIVYQQKGADLKGISLAINNVISDIGGMLCDGAKSGCALKVVSSADTAIRSAYMGMHHYGITEREGFIGRTAEETIRNLAKISTIGMAKVDATIVEIMLDKQRSCDA